MTTVAEIFDAVQHLEENEQRELAEKLRNFWAKPHRPDPGGERYELPGDFTARLTDAFNEARRTAIQRGSK